MKAKTLVWVGAMGAAAMAAWVAVSMSSRRVMAADATAADGEVRILYPADGSALTGNKIAIVAVAPAGRKTVRITLDGRELEAERMTFAESISIRGTRLYASTRPSDLVRAKMMEDSANKALWVAGAELSAGEHVIAAEGREVRVHYATNGQTPPAPWAKVYLHGYSKNNGVVNSCEKCHAMEKNGDGRVLGASPTPRSCEECHPEVDVQLTHRHVLDSISKCYSCHDPHASDRQWLLVDTQEKLCTACHEGGHSKR